MASAMGERTEFMVHENNTAEGKSSMHDSRSDMKNADQREEPACGLQVGVHFI